MEQSIEELPSYIAIDLITSNRTGSVHFETPFFIATVSGFVAQIFVCSKIGTAFSSTFIEQWMHLLGFECKNHPDSPLAEPNKTHTSCVHAQRILFVIGEGKERCFASCHERGTKKTF